MNAFDVANEARTNVRVSSQGSVRPLLAVTDMAVIAGSPAGSCVLCEVRGLAKTFDVVVFANVCDAGDASIRWIRVPAPSRPVFLRYWTFVILARVRASIWRMSQERPCVTQGTEGQVSSPTVAYAHFCHAAYLAGPWKQSSVSGLRRLARWINHTSNAWLEARAFIRARRIVVPSRGLAEEIVTSYPSARGRIEVIPNPVDVSAFRMPSDLDRGALRRDRDIMADAIVFSFAALGDFDRKGLGLIIEAVAGMNVEARKRTCLLVIGGSAGEIARFRSMAERDGVGACIRFLGLKSDIRPDLWASDVFILPSLYETFSLVVHQAAAAGLPSIVTTSLHGVSEVVQNDVSGWLVSRDASAIRTAMERAVLMRGELKAMGRAAQDGVQAYAPEEFGRRWEEFYRKLLSMPGEGNEV